MRSRLQDNPWVVLAILCPGIFMVLLDVTIVNIAVPDMTTDLGASLDEILWVVNAYALATATFIITAGRLGDLRGKQNLYLIGIGLFTLASAACGFAETPTQLIVLRAAQGVGAALLAPQTLSIIADTFPAGKTRGVALGVWGAVVGLSGVAGPTVGGLLINDLGWRWIFFVNVPIGTLALVLGLLFMSRREEHVKHRFDVVGVVLISATLFCFSFALIQGERYDWATWIWAMIGLSIVLLVLFLGYERTQQDGEPLLPFSLFKERNFTVVNMVGVVASFGVIGLLLPVVIYLQSVLHYSPLKAGLVLMALAIGGMIAAGPAGIIAERYGAKFILMFGMSAFTGGLVWFALVADRGAGMWSSVWPLLLAGAGASSTFTPMASEVVRKVPASLNGAASGVHNALRQVGSVIAAAVIGAYLQLSLAESVREHAEQSAKALPEPYQDGFVRGFSDAGAQGLDVGVDQGSNQLPDGVPADAAAALRDAAGDVFASGFIDAMLPTMLLAAAAMFVGTVACFALRGGVNRTVDVAGLPIEAEQAPGESEPREPAVAGN